MTNQLEILCGSSNPNKLREFKEILNPLGINLLPCPKEIAIEETGASFLENAILKATSIAKLTGKITVAEDAGLVVPALDGLPGIYSHRFSNMIQQCAHTTKDKDRDLDTLANLLSLAGRDGALPLQFVDGTSRNGEDLSRANNSLLLELMKDLEKEKRAAHFNATLVVARPNGEILFQTEQQAHGIIAKEEQGSNGFAYDKVFIANDSNGLTYAEISAEEKNKVSHRRKALDAFASWLKNWQI